MNVLVTGGAGYIGSHAVVALLEAGHAVTAIDNFARGHMGAITAVRHALPDADLQFTRLNIGNTQPLAALLHDRAIDAVMHFAAVAYVGESVDQPLRYYRNNAAGALSVLEAMELADVGRIVFSSTCSTYGEPAAEHIPIRETCPQQPVNPYGRSKLMTEWMISDVAASRRRAGQPFAATMLRYFNVAGADPHGRVGEDHRPETHLIPICLEAAIGQREHIEIFGTDYDTPDGTCIRDYVHVNDLIDAHIAAMERLDPASNEVRAYNLGIGRGYSVRDVIDATKRTTGVDFNTVEAPRRAGDPPTLWADSALAQRELEWRPRYAEIESMIEHAWRWKREHPDGYAQ